MPIYEYRCLNHHCGLRFEELILNRDKFEEYIDCPQCDWVAKKVEISVPARPVIK